MVATIHFTGAGTESYSLLWREYVKEQEFLHDLTCKFCGPHPL